MTALDFIPVIFNSFFYGMVIAFVVGCVLAVFRH